MELAWGQRGDGAMIRWMAALAAAGTLAWTGAAHADRLNVVYQGQAVSGSARVVDANSGASEVIDLSGLPFVFNVLLDTDRAQQRYTVTGSYDSVQGTTDANSPIVLADLTIGSYDFDLITGEFSGFGSDTISALGSGSYQTQSNSYRGSLNLGIEGFSGPSSLELPFTAEGSEIDPGNQNFYSNYFGASAELAPTSLTVTPASAAPEPATWVLLAIGVGFAGLALRRSEERLLA